MRKWQCSVCGYIHNGNEPPEKCPVCNADRSKFMEITDKEEPKEAQKSAESLAAREKKQDHPKDKSEPTGDKPGEMTAGMYYLDRLNAWLAKHHLHPVSVHIPNGVIPMAVIFMFLSALFHFRNLSTAAFYAMVFVLVTLPFVLYTGLNEWRRKYRAARTRRFKTKISAALVVTAGTLIIVVWYLIEPDVTQFSSASRWGFLLLNVITLAAATIAGYIGGKLVFRS